MPVKQNLLDRVLLSRVKLPVDPLLDLIEGGSLRAVGLALKLGVFDVLEDQGPLNASELASRVKASESGTAVLLGALEGFGYLKQKDGRYVNKKTTSTWLVRKSRINITDFIYMWDNLIYKYWDEYLEESVVKGIPSVGIYDWFGKQKDGWKLFQSGMVALARSTIDELLSRIILPKNARRLLDVGGGHGLYSVRFCQKYPQLSATVFDFPPALEIAGQNIASEGIESRVALKAGDYMKDDLGKGYDVAFLFNVIHAQLPEGNMELLRRVSESLNPKGISVIMEPFVISVPSPTLKAVTKFFDLTYFIDNLGRSYSAKEVMGWHSKAGFGNVTKVNLSRSAGGNAIIIGTKV